jgi:putative endonuclease
MVALVDDERSVGGNAIIMVPFGHFSSVLPACALFADDGVVVTVVDFLRCADGWLDIGSTYDLVEPLSAHNAGRGSAFTAHRRPVAVAYSESYSTRAAARQREARRSRAGPPPRMEAPIAGNNVRLHEFAREVREVRLPPFTLAIPICDKSVALVIRARPWPITRV